MDYHLIMDLVPTVARIFFLKQLGDISLSVAQCVGSDFVSPCSGNHQGPDSDPRYNQQFVLEGEKVKGGDSPFLCRRYCWA